MSTVLLTHTCGGSDDVITVCVGNAVLTLCRPYETLNFPYACLSQADLQCCWNLEPRSPQYRRSAQDAALSVGDHFHFKIYKDAKWQTKNMEIGCPDRENSSNLTTLHTVTVSFFITVYIFCMYWCSLQHTALSLLIETEWVAPFSVSTSRSPMTTIVLLGFLRCAHCPGLLVLGDFWTASCHDCVPSDSPFRPIPVTRLRRLLTRCYTYKPSRRCFRLRWVRVKGTHYTTWCTNCIRVLACARPTCFTTLPLVLLSPLAVS